jgi:cellulose synthase/poly-beta-1,6-N-acetylglucosamine synthase-like glycosyltransferase
VDPESCYSRTDGHSIRLPPEILQEKHQRELTQLSGIMTFSFIFFVFLITIGTIYCVIILLIFLGLFLTKNSGQQLPVFSTNVTTIIPARNEEENILNCLNCLLVQEYPSTLLEIILVDDGSTDQTSSIIEKFIAENPSFKLKLLKPNSTSGQGGSKKKAIIHAIANSSGELIIAADADVRPGKKWIAGMVAYYQEYHPKMILGPVAYNGSSSFFGKIQECEFMGMIAAAEGSCSLGRPLMCNGANLAYTRKSFESVGGFEDNLGIPSGDDMFLMMKIRKRFGRDAVQFNRSPDVIVFTAPNKNLNSFFRQRLRWVSKNRKVRDPFVLGVAVITYLFNAGLLAGMAVGFFVTGIWILTVSSLGVKYILEWLILRRYAAYMEKKNILKILPVVQVLNIFYVTFAGLLGNFISYEWKGRKINPSRKNSSG